MRGATREFLETYQTVRRRNSRSRNNADAVVLETLHHLDVDCNAGREIEVREGLDHLRRGVEDINEALMDAHLELFSRVLMDEGGAVDRPALELGGERHGADDDSIKARRRVHNLLHREVEDLVLIGTDSDAELVLCYRNSRGRFLLRYGFFHSRHHRLFYGALHWLLRLDCGRHVVSWNLAVGRSKITR